MGFTLILATLDGLDVGLLGDVIGEDDCDDDGCDDDDKSVTCAIVRLSIKEVHDVKLRGVRDTLNRKSNNIVDTPSEEDLIDEISLVL
ncbi:hypothetical protein Tco_1561154 [Tanacetum coccineum]